MNKGERKVNGFQYIFLYLLFCAYYLDKNRGDYKPIHMSMSYMGVFLLFWIISIFNIITIQFIVLSSNTYGIIIMSLSLISVWLSHLIVKAHIKKRYVQRFTFLEEKKGKGAILIAATIITATILGFTFIPIANAI